MPCLSAGPELGLAADNFHDLLRRLCDAHEAEVVGLRQELASRAAQLQRPALDPADAAVEGADRPERKSDSSSPVTGEVTPNTGAIEEAGLTVDFAPTLSLARLNNYEADNPIASDAPETTKSGRQHGTTVVYDKRFVLKQKWIAHQEQDNAALVFAQWDSSNDGGSHTIVLALQLEPPEQKGLSRFISAPGANRRLAWDALGAVLIAYDAVAIPFTLSFQPEESTFITMTDWIAMLYWTTDIVLSFLSGYTANGVNVMSPAKIARRYILTWFLLDVTLVVGDWFNNVGSASAGDGTVSGFARVLRSLRSIRMLRLLRLLKLRDMFARLQDHITSEYTYLLLSLIKQLLVILVVNHGIACTWYLLGRRGLEAGRASWVEANKMTSRSLGYRYSTSMHWSLTQFTPASMEVFPQNTDERIMSVVVLMFALVAFSSFVGSISTSMTQLRDMNADISKQFWLLRRYLKQRHIPRNLGMRVLKYLEFIIDKKQGTIQKDSIRILAFLSNQLEEELTFEVIRSQIAPHAMFKYMLNVSGNVMDVVVRRLAVLAMSYSTIGRGDTLFYPGDEGVNCYCFLSGFLDYTIDGRELDLPIQEMEWISEASLFVASWRHMGKMQAQGAETELMTWNAEKFVYICCESVTTWTPLSAFATSWLDLFKDLAAPTDVIRSEEFSLEIAQLSEQPLAASA